MKQVFFLAFFFLSYVVMGFEINEVVVTDQEKAHILISGDLSSQLPQWRSEKNFIELTIPNTKLSKKLTETSKLELEEPHILIKRLTAIENSGKVQLRFILNGSLEGLKDRLKLIPAEKGFLVSLDYPMKNATALKLLQQEQAPISSTDLKAPKSSSSAVSPIATVITLFLAFTALLGFMFVRYTKKQASVRGTRKYLIEQVSYFPLGTKTGVSLVKVGKEFVLLGVTPQSITTLSHMPKLQEQYEEETGFERGVFKESVAEEMHKMRVA